MMKDILVIDEDPQLQEIVSGELEQKPEFADCRFHFCATAEAALYFTEWHPKTAVVVVDLALADMDALSLIYQLQQKNSQMQAIVVSAQPDLGGMQKAMDLGLVGFLSKPINAGKLSEILQKAIGQAKSVEIAEEAKVQILMMNKDLDLSAQIQKSILPLEFPTHPMYEMYGRTQPAKGVGGDFYDFYPITKTKLGFVVGDASGKGFPAAIYMALCQGFLRTLVDFFPDPGELLGELNRQLCLLNQSDHFVTIFYGVFDTRMQQIDFALGGHPPPFILRKDGHLHAISASQRNTLVGVFPEERFVTQSIPFNPGDSLVAYSDGIVNSGDMVYAEEKFKDYIRLLAGSSCKDLIDSLFDTLAVQPCPRERWDDRTILALRNTCKRAPGQGPFSNLLFLNSEFSGPG